MERLSSVVECWSRGIKEDIGHDFITTHINTVEELSTFFDHCNNNEAFRAHTISSYSWQLFDKIHDISLANNVDVEPLLDMIKVVCEHTKPRELHIIIAEKLVVVHSIATFEVILNAIQCTLRKTVDTNLWTEVLSRVLRKIIQLCSSNQNESNEDYYNEEEQQEEVDMKTENPDRSTYAHLAIAFAKNLSCLNVNEQTHTALMGYWLQFNSHVVTLFPDPCDRTPLLNSTAIQILQLLNGQLYDLFDYIYAQKEDVFHHGMRVEKRKFCTQYCHRYSDTVKERGAAVPLTTEDVNILLNKIAMSEHSTVMMNYYERVCRKLMSPSVLQYSEDSADRYETLQLPSTVWSSVLGFDQLTEERLAILVATQEAGRESGSGQRMLSWSLSGIALFGLCILRTLHSPTTTPTVVTDISAADSSTRDDCDANLLRTLLPHVYNPAQLLKVLRPYANTLLRSTVFATYEGLQLVSALYPPSSIVASTVRSSGNIYPSPLPVFLPFLAQTPTATALSHLLLSAYHCLPLHPEALSRTEGASWSGESGARIGAMAASSTDHLALSQTLISAMTQCSDTGLRTAAFQSLRTYLKGIEERSLFGLLGVLIEQCPYPNMAGLLVDLAKECTQAASATTIPESGRAGWSTLHCPAYTTTTSTTTATSISAPSQKPTRQHPWRLSAFSTEPSAARTAYLKKLFKPHPTTTPAPTTAAEVDIDTLALRRYKVPSSQQQPGSATTGSAPDEDSFLELSSGATQLGPEKILELWAAAPYVWPGRSPFWSPLLLRKTLLEPLKEYIQHHRDEQMEEVTDIIAARINLVQFIALKFLSDDDFTDTKSTGITGIVQAYFQGCAISKTGDLGNDTTFPYAYSSLKAVRDIFELYYTIRILYDTLQDRRKSTTTNTTSTATTTGTTTTVGGGGEQIVRTQLLEMNITHVLQLLKRICQYLYKYI